MVKLALNMTWTIKNDREAAKFKIDGVFSFKTISQTWSDTSSEPDWA